MLVGTAALMILGVQPLLLGALTEDDRLSTAALGRLATIENLAIAACSAVGWAAMGGPRMRVKGIFACVALAIADLGIYGANTGGELFVLRTAAGALEGLLLGAAILILTATARPDRVNGLFLAVQTLPQMVAAYVLPVSIIPRWGSNAGFALLGVIAMAAVAGAWALRAPDLAKPGSACAGSPTGWASLIGLAAVVVQNAGIGGAWNYFERVGTLHHFGPSVIGVALSGSLAAQVAGAFFVAWIGWRAPYRIVLPIGIAVQAFIVLALAHVTSSASYTVIAAGFGLLWLGLQPYQIRQLLALDPSRRSAFLVLPLALTGLSLGPFAVSLAVEGNDVSGCFQVAAAFLLLGAVLFAAARRSDRPMPVTPRMNPGRTNDAC